MKPSLCVLLPVRNVQSALADQVSHLLEVVAEITTSFELLIVDNASTDATYEVASDLSRSYPQVSLLRSGEQQEMVGLVYAGMNETRSDIVIVRAGDDEAYDVSAIEQLWKLAAAQLNKPIKRKARGGRESFTSDLARIAELLAPTRSAQQQASLGGFRLCRPITVWPSDVRRDEAAENLTRPSAASRKSSSSRIARIRSLLSQ